jgi:large repetitive protein
MKSCLLSILLIVFVSQCRASVVEITTKNVPNGTEKTHYSAVIAANGGCTPYRWAVVSGKLPPGVEEKASTTTTSLDLSGTPTTAASYPLTVSVKDCGGHVSEHSYKIVIKAAIDITTTNVPSGTEKTHYSAVIAANGGCRPYRWAVVSGKLPPGVEEKASTTTTSLDLSGTPTIAASYPLTVSVKDCGGHVSEHSYKIVIKAAIDITTTNVPNGTAKTYYSAVIAANGGCTPYRWAVVSGKLPPGVEEKASTTTTSLDLSGTPTIAASYPLTVSVKDCGGHVSEHSYKIVIKAATSYVVDLRWDASTSNDVAGYNVYRGPDGVRWEKINDSLIPSTYYNDSTVSDGSTYFYSATTVSVRGEESKKTSAIKVSIPE